MGVRGVAKTRPDDEARSMSARSALARCRLAIQILSLLVIGFALFVIIRSLPMDSALRRLEMAVDNTGVWGVVVFVVVYSLAITIFLPATPLTLAAGAIFGTVVGSIATLAGSLAGTAMSFLLSRYLVRKQAKQLLQRSPRLQAVDKAIGERGWQTVMLLRLAPFAPLGVQNYVYGISAVKFWPCMLASLVAMPPGIVLYAYLGSVARRGALSSIGPSTVSVGFWVTAGVIAVTAIVTALYLKRLTARILQLQTAEAARSRFRFRREGAAWPMSTPLLALGALLLAVAAAWVHRNPERFQAWFDAGVKKGVELTEPLLNPAEPTSAAGTEDAGAAPG